MKRSVKFSNHICGGGCKRFYSVNARLFKNDEERRGSALNEVTSTVYSLDTTRDFKESDLKLDIHRQFKGGETPLLLLESRLSEEIKKNSLPVGKIDVSKNRESLKSTNFYVSNSKVNEFNIMTNLIKTERHEILTNQIFGKWDYKVNKSLKGFSKIESALNRKQIPLYRKHHAS